MTSSHNRIGESERASAQHALEYHRAEGNLDSERYERRSALVATSQTSEDLDALFIDLPLPHYDREVMPNPDDREVVPQPTVAPLTPSYLPTQQVMCEVIDPWDKPLGSSPLTLRKVRTMGWIVAIGTTLFTFEPLSKLFPESLADLVFFSPIVVMGIIHVVIRPSESKTYRRVDEDPSHRSS
ncbi:DUF1707 domain-containing protein [Stomatohabitans albus]|uniref:DUF1707 SHOCT-like domain-containing protein n=1 Tax=Stomatohabitans albus TaxID=3110766 RepID=UPI00300DBC31